MTKTFTTEYVPINGIQQFFLHYEGTSHAVAIMLHGGPAMPNSYLAHAVQPFWKGCHAVYYDQRGSGKTAIKSPVLPDTLSMDVLLEDLKQTVAYVKKKYATDRVVLVGHSWGSMLGTQYIVKYPKDVAGYIGYGQVTDFYKQDQKWFQDLKRNIEAGGKQRDLKKLKKYPDFPDISPTDYVDAFFELEDLSLKYGYMANKKFKSLYRKSPLMTFKDGMQMGKSPQNYRKIVETVFPRYSIEHMTEYEVPVFYVLGRHDDWTCSDLASAYFETIKAPQKGLYWIEDAGHMVDTDNPVAFCQAVNEIIEGLA